MLRESCLRRVLKVPALAAAGFALFAAALLVGSPGANTPEPPASGASGYVVFRHVLLDGDVISRPEHDSPGSVNAQYTVNKHRWAAASMPVTVAYNASGAPEGIDAAPLLQDAIAKWNAIAPQSFSFAWAGNSTGSAGSCGASVQRDGINTVTFADDLPIGTLGQTCTVWSVSGGASAPLVEFDMELSSKVRWSIDETTPANRYDLWSTILHEMGHAAGLGHTEDGSAVMYASLKAGAQKRTLAGDDRQGLIAAYPGSTNPTPTPTPSLPRDFTIVTANVARD
ncbi:MAG: hypothetical protein AMXMBFR80_17540 [Dehalococcoidia bacterium]